jgi:hypothetical protein
MSPRVLPGRDGDAGVSDRSGSLVGLAKSWVDEVDGCGWELTFESREDRASLEVGREGGVKSLAASGAATGLAPRVHIRKIGKLFRSGGGGLNLCHLRGPLPHWLPRADFFSAPRVLKTLWGIKTIKGRSEQQGSALKSLPFWKPSRGICANCPQESEIIFHERNRVSGLNVPRKNVAKFGVGGRRRLGEDLR